MDMSKYRVMFLSESREHLKNMGNLLLALEKDPADREGIDALFREAHSIKGMAASMSFDRTAELAHHLEDLMDGFRSSGSVPPAAVDRLLDGVDLLEGLLEDIEGERPEREIALFLEASGGRKADKAPEPTPPEEESWVEPIPEEELLPDPAVPPSEEPGGGSPPPADNLHDLIVHLAPNTVAPAARALLLLRAAGQAGQVVAAHPSEEELAKGGEVSRLRLQLRSDWEPGQFERLFSSFTEVEKISFPLPSPPERLGGSRREDAARTVRVRTDLLDQFINLTGELITRRYMLKAATQENRWQDVREGMDQLTRLISSLHHHVLQVRMMPLESVAGRLPRVVRDLGRKSGKEVTFRLEGGEIELDRAILEELADPLLHMVRNAVDHGIETAGTVSVRAWREKDLVLIEVADDGRGMDAKTIRKKAVAKGLLSAAKAKALRDRDALQLVCFPGFSTADQVTETSGRGVGMDVVKSAVENLGGILEIDSAPGRGTRILLKLPLSVAIIQILLVECQGHTLGIPITRVLRTLEVPREEVHSSGRQLVIREDEDLVPLLSLSKILKMQGRGFRHSVPLVVTEFHGRRVALVVDRLVGQQEVFVKPLSFPLDGLALGGGAILGDGRVVFIIDPQTLLEEKAGLSFTWSTGDPS